jgi:hypothetical protein
MKKAASLLADACNPLCLGAAALMAFVGMADGSAGGSDRLWNMRLPIPL